MLSTGHRGLLFSKTNILRLSGITEDTRSLTTDDCLLTTLCRQG